MEKTGVLADGAARAATWRKKPSHRPSPVGARRSQTPFRCPVSLHFRAGRLARDRDLVRTLALTCAMRALANLVRKWGLSRRASADRKRKRNAASTRTTLMGGAAVRFAMSRWRAGRITADALAMKACAGHARFPSKLAAIAARSRRIFRATPLVTRRAAYDRRHWTMDHRSSTNGREFSIAANLAEGSSTVENIAARRSATRKIKRCHIVQEVRT